MSNAKKLKETKINSKMGNFKNNIKNLNVEPIECYGLIEIKNSVLNLSTEVQTNPGYGSGVYYEKFSFEVKINPNKQNNIVFERRDGILGGVTCTNNGRRIEPKEHTEERVF